jgi:hypothetical protein
MNVLNLSTAQMTDELLMVAPSCAPLITVRQQHMKEGGTSEPPARGVPFNACPAGKLK